MRQRQERWQIWIENRKELEIDFKDYADNGLIRKITPDQKFAKIHSGKSFHNLDFANFTMANHEKISRRLEGETYFDWVITISYYAMYHSALALLRKIGYKTSSHLATICALCKECLGKTLERSDIENLSKILCLSEIDIKEMGMAKERREKASYSGSVSFEKYLAELTFEDARKFVNKIADIIAAD